jgi:hypothetical protein
MLGSARILGAQRGDLPDGVFLYIELFDFQIRSGRPSAFDLSCFSSSKADCSCPLWS